MRIHATTCLSIMPRHCSANSRGAAVPATMRRCAVSPRGTVPPTPVRPAHHTLEKGRRNPRRDDTRLLRARTGRRRDVRPVGAVTSVAINPLPPPPPHCDAIPATASPCLTQWKHAATGHCHASHCALYDLMSTAPSNPHADDPRMSNLYATPLKAAPGRAQDTP
jgi:hypothetical protein